MRRGAAADAALVPAALAPLRRVREQLRYVHSPHRFNIVPAGRRGGKTERAKRKLFKAAMRAFNLKHGKRGRFFAAAPTRQQAKNIWWADLKAMTRLYWTKTPSETELTIYLPFADIVVVGMDVPERIEGAPWDGGVLDEYANMKEQAFTANVRPALSDRLGWCDLIGVPEGRNHYYDRWQSALAMQQEKGAASLWGAYTWFSAVVLPPSEIEAAREDLDQLTFEQEYEASFINFLGRAYYGFSTQNTAALRQHYNPNAPLAACFDFNVSPGVMAVAQELRMPNAAHSVTGVLGEVYIENNSNTVMVCEKFVNDWGNHQGLIEVYGDATGGARKTSALSGSDWDLVKVTLRAHFGPRVDFKVPPSNPSERARVNAVNVRCLNAAGQRRLLVDGAHAPHVVKDLDGVRVIQGGSGEIDKKHDRRLTHVSDALGYYVVTRFPVARMGVSSLALST